MMSFGTLPFRLSTLLARLAILLSLYVLTGCSATALQNGSILVYVETGQGEAGRRRSDDLGDIRQMMNLVLREYKLSEPMARVQTNYIERDALLQEVKYRHSLGIGPDLVISSMRNALELKNQGLTRPFRLNQDELLETHQRHSGAEGQVDIIPAAIFPHVACFRRQSVSTPPRTRSELLEQASKGLAVGLTFNIHNLYWLGVTEETRGIWPLLISPRQGKAAERPKQQFTTPLANFLEELRGIRLQKNITFYQSIKELDQAFQEGLVDWIPCRGPSLRSHSQRLGPRLGISPLPGEARSTPAVSITSQKVFTLGPHSNPRQRRTAEKFVALSSSRAMQKDILLAQSTWFPVNQRVLIPTELAAYHAALKTSFDYSESIMAETAGSPVQRTEEVNRIVQDVVYGFITPEMGATLLLDSSPDHQ